MRRIRILGHRLRSLFFRSRREDELAREIDLHVNQLVKELMADGMREAEARTEARRQFGPAEVMKEECRDMRRVGLWDDLFRDIRFALRMFRKSPGFTLAAVITLALGIGANTAIFQLFDAVRLRTLPVPRPEELVMIRINGEGRMGNFRGRNSAVTNAIWEEFQRRQRSFAGVIAFGDTLLNLAPSGELRNVEGLWVSGSFFSVLGVRPQLGRLISTGDDHPGCGWPGVVISHAFWQREFGSDPNVLSRTLPIDGQSVPILGVTQPEFFGVELGRRFDVAMPICSAPSADLKNRMHFFLNLMARLKPEVPQRVARAELLTLSRGVFEATVPPYSPRDQARFTQLQFDLADGAAGQAGFRDGSEPLTFVLGMVSFVLLLACANLASMMLARATAREHEFAVRASLGASRWRIVRQVLVENLLLAFAGASAGAAAAPAVAGMLMRMLSTSREKYFLPLEFDMRLLAYTFFLGATATLLFGLAPSLRAGRMATRGASASREKFIFRRALLVVQVALCMVLLTAALLFSRSFRNLLSTELGFQPSGVLVVNTFFDSRHYAPESRLPAIEELHRRLSAIPGASLVARGYVIPISGSSWDRGARANLADQPRATNLTSVSDDYFRVMNTPLLTGRTFNSGDRPNTTPVAIVNQAFAKRFFDGKNPVGKMFWLDSVDEKDPPLQIVGLVANAKYDSIAEEFGPIAYFAASQERTPRLTVRYLIRSTASPDSLINPVKQVIAGFDPRLHIRFVVLQTQIEESVSGRRVLAALTSAFGLLGAMIALTGVFGVTAYIVARRYREFGVRLALGATSSGIVRLVLSELATVLLAGVLLGGTFALAAGRIASTLLYGVQPHDAPTFLLVIALLGVGGFTAGLIPALRASRVPPVEALRVE